MPMMPMMGAGMAAGGFPASLGDMMKGAGKGQAKGPFGGMVKQQGQGGFVGMEKPTMATPPAPSPAGPSKLAQMAQRFVQMQNMRKAPAPPAAPPPGGAPEGAMGGGMMGSMARAMPGAVSGAMGRGGFSRMPAPPEASAYGPAGGPGAEGAINAPGRQQARLQAIMQMLRSRGGSAGAGGFAGGMF